MVPPKMSHSAGQKYVALVMVLKLNLEHQPLLAVPVEARDSKQ